MWQKIVHSREAAMFFTYLLTFKARAIFVPILRAAKKPYWPSLNVVSFFGERLNPRLPTHVLLQLNEYFFDRFRVTMAIVVENSKYSR